MASNERRLADFIVRIGRRYDGARRVSVKAKKAGQTHLFVRV